METQNRVFLVASNACLVVFILGLPDKRLFSVSLCLIISANYVAKVSPFSTKSRVPNISLESYIMERLRRLSRLSYLSPNSLIEEKNL